MKEFVGFGSIRTIGNKRKETIILLKRGISYHATKRYEKGTNWSTHERLEIPNRGQQEGKYPIGYRVRTIHRNRFYLHKRYCKC